MFFLLWPQVLTPITETTFSNALVSFQMDDRFHLPARSTPTLTIAFTPSEAAPATFLEHPAHSHCQNCTQHNDISTSPSLLQRPHHRTLFLLAYSSKSFRSFCSPAWRSPRLTSLTSSHLHFFPTFTNTEHTHTHTHRPDTISTPVTFHYNSLPSSAVHPLSNFQTIVSFLYPHGAQEYWICCFSTSVDLYHIVNPCLENQTY